MKSSLNIAFQMDPFENLDLRGDTTFALALEACNREYNVSHFTPNDLFYRNGTIYAFTRGLKVFLRDGIEKFVYQKKKVEELSKYDCILMRQDPPFDLAYITATHLLEKLSKKTVIINNPFEVRNAPEKIFVTNFNDLMPKTIITRNLQSIIEFRDHYKNIIIKPLYGNGGDGVFHVNPNDNNFNSILEVFLKNYKEQFIVQEYIPDIVKGDKRIILIDGEIAGAINRIPAKGESRSNLHVGGKPKKTKLNENDIEICNKISPFLKSKGLFFVGIDVIGNYLTEINVTSPTGIREINYYNDTKIEKLFWNKLEKKLIDHNA